MALLNLVFEGDERLRKKSIKIRKVDDGLRKLADDMWETMHHERGVGLAAPQIGMNVRMVVIHVPAEYDDEDPTEYQLTLVNPEIVKAFGETVGPEGCLSIPGWVGEVPRAASVVVKAMDITGKPVRIKAENHLAVVLQHEIDHLDGILFTDRVEDRSTLQYVQEEEPAKEASASAV